MPHRNHCSAALALSLVLLSPLPALAQASKTQRVQFKPGATSATITGTIKGDQDIDYVVGAKQGQSMNVSMATKHGSTYFNILAPGVMEDHFTVGFTHKKAGGNELNFSFMYAPEVDISGPQNFDPTQTVELSMSQFELEVSYSWKR